MSNFVISTRYANSLMSISEEKDSLKEAIKDILFVKETLDVSRELRVFLSNPIISPKKKSDALKEIFESHVSKEVNSFLQFLITKGRENLLFEICKRFLSLSNEKLNRVDVEIISAVELSDIQKNEIKSKLETMINKIVVPSFDINSKIIGGFKAKFNDTVVDASIKHQLELLEKKLFEEDYLRN